VAFVEGSRLVTCDADGSLRWWDASTGRLLCGPPTGTGGETSALAISPDGRTLVAGTDDGRVVRRDLASERVVGPTLPHGSPIRKVAFLGDGRRILVATRDGRVLVWHLATLLVSALPPEGMAVTSLAVSPDGDRFVTGTEGGTVRLWDATTLRQSGPTFKLTGAVRCLAFRPDRLALAVGLEDGTLRIWEVPRVGPVAPPLTVGGPVRTVAFGRDGEHLLAVGGRGPRRWGLGRRAEPPGPVPVGPRFDFDGSYDGPAGSPGIMAVSPDGRRIAVSAADGPGGLVGSRVLLLDAESGAVVGEGPGETHLLVGVAFSPDSRWLLTWGPQPGTGKLHEVDVMGPGRPLLRSLGVAIHHAAFGTDGGTLLLGCRDGMARLWDVSHDVEIEDGARPYHAYPITAVAFDPRAPRIVTGCHAGTVRLWDRASGALLHDVRGNAGEVTAVAFSPDGVTLLTASLDATARFWDVASGRQLGPPLYHTDAVLSIAFHPGGRVVATGTRDGSAWLWRVPPAPLEGDPARIARLVAERTGLRPDGR
jgi:WD40 repeat protein